jgi:hypothetical protein
MEGSRIEEFCILFVRRLAMLELGTLAGGLGGLSTFVACLFKNDQPVYGMGRIKIPPSLFLVLLLVLILASNEFLDSHGGNFFLSRHGVC